MERVVRGNSLSSMALIKLFLSKELTLLLKTLVVTNTDIDRMLSQSLLELVEILTSKPLSQPDVTVSL